MAPRACPGCGSKDVATDYALGTVVCQACGLELEQGILVSEVGFTEGAGGRMHVQGTFVSHQATGISGFGSGPTSENVKEEGRRRIQLVCQQMGIMPSVQRGAQRFYSLAVDNKFNRGRRTDHVVASCIYLYSRFEKDALMLIDFSERLQINVYELGATYLKLRSCLNLDQILPEIDPAVYNIRFANRLDFGAKASTIARDASRLVKRFKADWMTAGRRPAGICGACLVIAARMNDYLRTPEEVAQVVKVSPLTIKKRLMEFAQTSAAGKTLDEWRALTDADLEAEDVDELPPVMKRAKRKEEQERLKRERTDMEESEAGTSRAGSVMPSPKRRRTAKVEADSAIGALRAAARGLSVGSDAEVEEDEYMDPLAKEDYVADIQTAGDNSDAARAQRALERRRLFASLRRADGTDLDPEELEDILPDELGDVTIDVDEDGKVDSKADEDGDSPLQEINDEEDALVVAGGFKDLKLPDWEDTEAVFAFIEENIFHDQEALYGGNPTGLREHIERWLRGRPPADVIGEMRRVEWARHEREWFAKHHAESSFDDIDDDELDRYWVMDEDERQARARMWLSHNARWLEEDKERQERRAAYNRAHGIDPNKPAAAKSKKRRAKNQRTMPFSSAREAIDNFAAQKKFSSRINMDAIRKLESGPADEFGLQTMEDKEDDEHEYHFDFDDKVDDKVDDKYD